MAKTIVINKDGDSPYTDPHEKLERVKAGMKTTLEDIKMKIAKAESNPYAKGKPNFNLAINNKLNIVLRQEKFMEYSDAILIDEETLNEYYQSFLQLLDYIFEYDTDYVASKQVFCGFCGFTTAVYNKLKTSQSNPAIIDIIDNAEDLFVDTSFSSAQAGVSKEQSSISRLKEKTYGHDISVKSDSETTVNMLNIGMTPNEQMKRLNNILGLPKK